MKFKVEAMLLITVLFLVSSIEASDLSKTYKQKKCNSLGSGSVCKKLVTYNETQFPNMFNHRNEAEAGIELSQFEPLIKIGCSPDLAGFLCASYIPICVEDYAGFIPPCRHVCEQARNGCKAIMEKFGFAWPEALNCARYPTKSNKNICFGPEAPTLRPTTVKPEGTAKPRKGWETFSANEKVVLKCKKESVVKIRKVRHQNSSCCPTATLAVLSAMCDGEKTCRFQTDAPTLGGHCKDNVGETLLRYKCVSELKTKNC